MKQRPRRVLVIDPNPEFASSVAAILRDAGHLAYPCTAGAHDASDLLVIGLPAPWNVSPSLDAGVPVLLLIGSASHGQIEAWTRCRPRFGLLAKPVAPTRLLEAVDDLLATD